jgi:AcrR family transcriptional regulator
MKDDPRIIKTIGKLQKAFILLLKTYNVSDINVRQISDEAGVTRGAFYSHFSDKQDFVKFTINTLVDALFDTALKDSAEVIFEPDYKNMHRVNVLSLSKFFNGVAEEYQTYTIVMAPDKLPDFTSVLKERLDEELKRFIEF